MNRKAFFVTLLALFSLHLVLSGRDVIPESTKQSSRSIDAIISTQWLDEHFEDENLVILDLRDPKTYAIGHIRGSVNITAPGNFFECFMDPDCGLWMELPTDEALFRTIGNAGITAESTVILFGETDITHSLEAGYYGLTLSGRVAITLLYAGIENVAILEGGYPKWLAEGREISTENVVPDKTIYQGETKGAMFVQKDYIEAKIGNSSCLIHGNPILTSASKGISCQPGMVISPLQSCYPLHGSGQIRSSRQMLQAGLAGGMSWKSPKWPAPYWGKIRIKRLLYIAEPEDMPVQSILF